MRQPLAYVIGRYPAASHAFIQREIEGLRAARIEIETITIRPPHGEELITDADRAAAESTYAVLPAGPLKLGAAHLAALFRRPLAYLETLGYALSLGRGMRGKLWQLFYFAEAVVVWRRCRKLGATHLHTHFADTGTDSALLAAHLEPEWSFSITVHGPDEFAEATDNRLAEKLERAQFVVAVSDDAARKAGVALGDEGAAGADAAKIHVIRLGVDTERFAPSGEPAPRGQGGGGHPAARVLCLGRLVDRKGQALLLEAAALLAREGVALELTIAGDGPNRQALEAFAAELGIAGQVHFTGVVGQDEALRLYRETDIFCLPSLSEGLPAVLMEAMACGVPVVATRIDANAELVEDGQNGLLVGAGDADALAEGLRRLAGDPALGSRLGQAGQKTVRERYSLERQVAELRELFSRVG